MSGIIVSESSVPPLKQSWAERTVSSMGPPPLPLLAVFGIVVFYLYLSDSYERALFALKVFFVLFPLFLFFLLRGGSSETGVAPAGFRIPTFRMAPGDSEGGGGTGKVALVLVLVLMLICWHPSLKSKWVVPSSSSSSS